MPKGTWFHRFSRLVGIVKVPSMRGLLSQRRIQIGYALHLASALAGVAAIASGFDALARLTGVLLAATGVVLGSGTPDSTLSGTPTVAGSYAFTLQVQDSRGYTDTQGFSITVSDPNISTSAGTGTAGPAHSMASQTPRLTIHRRRSRHSSPSCDARASAPERGRTPVNA